MAKRGNGEGTISKRKDGRWCAVITEATTLRQEYKKESSYMVKQGKKSLKN